MLLTALIWVIFFRFLLYRELLKFWSNQTFGSQCTCYTSLMRTFSTPSRISTLCLRSLRLDAPTSAYRCDLGWLMVSNRRLYFIGVLSYNMLRSNATSYLADAIERLAHVNPRTLHGLTRTVRLRLLKPLYNANLPAAHDASFLAGSLAGNRAGCHAGCEAGKWRQGCGAGWRAGFRGQAVVSTGYNSAQS